MAQVNVNQPSDRDSASTAGANLGLVLVAIIVMLFVVWLLFAGPGRAMFGGGTDININPPASGQQQPAAPAPQAPAQQQPAAPQPAPKSP